MAEQTFNLNPAQQAAVDITDGAVLVVAGAGTGKTRVIVERIIRLIQDGVQPEHILALTFTEKAAGEMLDRVSEASLGAALDTTIATFNGFGNDRLKEFGSEWGLGAMTLLSETGQMNTLLHGWIYESAGDREAKRAAMAKDPDWKHFVSEKAKAGNIAEQHNWHMTPVPFAPPNPPAKIHK